MGSWRMLGAGFAALTVIAIVGSVTTSMTVVLPPLVAAAVVLLVAALAVDYFGFARRHTHWHGRVVGSSAVGARAATLARRFRRQRARGSVRTPATARALLLALAELDHLREAGDVVDFLASEASTRVGADPVADALRSLALAELGRVAEARRVVTSLGDRVAGQPVVALARARVADAEGQPREALHHLDRALSPPGHHAPSPPQRDLAIAKARLLCRLGRNEDARALLAWLVERGHRREVEALLVDGETPVAMAARAAFALGAVYR